MASKLASVQRGKLKSAHRFMFYGPEGVGKSSLLASAPNPIVLDIEDGTGNLDIPRYMFRGEPGGHVPRTYQDVLEAIEDLTTNPHDFKTLGIDTADRLEALIHKFMLVRDSQPCAMNKTGKAFTSVEDYGYGKGYQLAVEEWRGLCRKLDELRSSRGMDVVILAHAQIKNFKNPLGDDYDRYSLRVNEKAGGWLKEWADVTGFVCWEEGASRDVADDDRARGYSTGRRLIKFTRSAAHDAKTRLVLPDEIELMPTNGWEPLAKAVGDSDDLEPKQIADSITEELKRFNGDPIADKARIKTAAALKAGDRATLINYLNWLKNQQPQTKTEGAAQ